MSKSMHFFLYSISSFITINEQIIEEYVYFMFPQCKICINEAIMNICCILCALCFLSSFILKTRLRYSRNHIFCSQQVTDYDIGFVCVSFLPTLLQLGEERPINWLSFCFAHSSCHTIQMRAFDFSNSYCRSVQFCIVVSNHLCE